MKKVFWALVPAVALGIGAGALAQSGWKLNINGASVTTSAKTIGGKTYVPIEDVARALKMKATIKGTQISLVPAGGTYQIANKLVGDQGEDLFSGKWTFQVVSVQRGPSFKSQYVNRYNRDDNYQAEGTEELVVVTCRLKNNTKNETEFAFSPSDYGMNTALTDTNANAYKPAGYDVFAQEGAPLGKSALPGASIPFNIVFRVPQNTQLKDLVYSVVLYNERGDHKSTDFRVALKPNTP